MALKDIMLNKNMNNGSQPSKSTLLMHQVRTVISPKVLKNREKLGGETSSPTDITDDASESVGDVSITSKDSGRDTVDGTFLFSILFARVKEFVNNC